MKKVLFVFGTRPEAIKLASLIKVFQKDTKNFRTVVAVTAQHREMLDQALSLFNILPDYDLNLMKPDQTLESLTSKILLGISDLLDKIKPDFIFVQGDTTTTFASALSAYYKKIHVCHVEAGLRTNNIFSPFPEEINRRMTSSLSTFHFAPTEQSAKNLVREGVTSENILITGNTVIDALLYISNKVNNSVEEHENYFANTHKINFNQDKTILVTGHRRESFGKGFENICIAIKKLAQSNNNLQFVYPVHLNPNVQKPVNRILGNLKNVFLIPPQDYEPFIFLMKNAEIILTDSGGVQEEAPSLGKPVLVLRDTTERPEGIESGTSKLIGTDVEKIISQIKLLSENKNEYNKMAKAVNPYGDGDAAKKIIYFMKNTILAK